MPVVLKPFEQLRPRQTPVVQLNLQWTQTWYGWLSRFITTLQGNEGATVAAVNALQTAIGGGITVTITTAALTGGGTQGSMTFTNGVLTAQTQAT
jgi:hypothetical protein